MRNQQSSSFAKASADGGDQQSEINKARHSSNEIRNQQSEINNHKTSSLATFSVVGGNQQSKIGYSGHS
jgi:hypothetical protein